jgi:hypothetical protein
MEKALVVASGLCAVLAFFLGFLLRGGPGEKAAAADDKKLEELKHEIENTPAGDLIGAAPDAGDLRSDIAGIAGRVRKRLRDRARKILSGNRAGGADEGG